jgi:4-amino-4-deoxy-L-arabinose transferase-like glycosyltransferase
MFFPLVVVAAVLPGLYALNWWDLTPPGPWWGLRGLAVREGMWLDQLPLARRWPAGEAWGYRWVALQPPLYAWLEGFGFWISSGRDPIVSVLPSYASGVAVVVLVYWLGWIWFGPGLGLTAALLTAFNRQLLIQMQQASPVTLGLAGVLGVLLAYNQHQRHSANRSWPWVLASGLSLALALMSTGLAALVCVPIVLLHQAILVAGVGGGVSPGAGRLWRNLRGVAAVPGGVVAAALALALAAPWYAMMSQRYGHDFVMALVEPHPLGVSGPAPNLLVSLLDLAPTTLPLALYALARTARQVLTAESDDPATVGGSFWLAWLAVASLVPALWPGGPRGLLGLILLVPLNLLAARVMVDLAYRRIPARTLVWLAPLTAMSVAWSLSDSLQEAAHGLGLGQLPAAQTLLDLHLGLDLILVLAISTRFLDRWARRRDRRRRVVLAGFLLTVLAITAATGLKEVRFRHAETSELIDLRTVILRRERREPLDILAVVSPDPATARDQGGLSGSPGGRLRFILRSALPHLAQFDLTNIQDLTTLPRRSRLVVLVGPEPQLPYALQAQLGLETLHPGGRTGIPGGRSGMLTAFASVDSRPRIRR